VLNTRLALLPLTVRLAAPGPLMVRFLLMAIWPVVRVIVPVTPTLSVLPAQALAIALRSDPAPASLVLVTEGGALVKLKLADPGMPGAVAETLNAPVGQAGANAGDSALPLALVT